MYHVLKPEYKDRLKDDEKVQVDIAQAFDKRLISVYRWIRKDDPMLTTITAIEIMKAAWELPKDTELTELKEPVHV